MKKSKHRILNTKEFRCFECQKKLLEERGMDFNERNPSEILKSINYYRLSGYWYHFQDKVTEHFKENVSMEYIEKMYYFDSDFRRIIFQLLESTEIKLRTAISYIHAKNFGPIGYRRSETFSSKYNHSTFINIIIDERLSSSENKEFVRHNVAKYGKNHIPFWVLVEILTYNNLSILYQHLKIKERDEIYATLIPVHPVLLEKWNFALTDLRNECAHHNRMVLTSRYAIDVHNIYSSVKPLVEGSSLFAYTLAAKHILGGDKNWTKFVASLSFLFEYYNISPKIIDFPENWIEIANI